ncbi:porin [Methylobacterium soli]|uniref:Porin n=1 Tax=Methylobacterium soli TaxID=553447 RepID=A0A6L3T1I4_9HYPH|nr:porin [Methylobacterium soli]KAB1078916.1 hypothetical protein F6X53_12995 [Methylobacterium soli]GJE44413.1 hypothetical protein AEGHOMDF_3601 [Methylobacterium soli]
MANRVRAGLVAGLLAGCLAPATAREPAKVPAPEPLRPCPAFGSGFVRIPGSRSCIRLSGRVGAGIDLRAGHGGAAAAPAAAGRFAIDTRSESELGPVRTFVRIGNGRP